MFSQYTLIRLKSKLRFSIADVPLNAEGTSATFSFPFWNKSCWPLYSALIYAASGIFVAQDIVVLVLPLPALYSLRMDMRKKLNVMFMFSIGMV
jgi:hypothetical protein